MGKAAVLPDEFRGRNRGALAAPVLLMVAENDTGSRRTRGMNTL